jgi:hypothetical protein
MSGDIKKAQMNINQLSVAYPGIFFGGVQQIKFRIEGRENRDLEPVAP